MFIQKLLFTVIKVKLPFFWFGTTREGLPRSYTIYELYELFGEGFKPDNLEKLMNWVVLEVSTFNSNHSLAKLKSKEEL